MTTRIAAVHGLHAPHRYPQQAITDMIAAGFQRNGGDRRLLETLHRSTRVRTRHLVLPLERYPDLTGFQETNDVFIRQATALGARAVDGALRAAGLRPADVDLLMFTSVTGLATPSVDARLVQRLGLRPDVRRLPVFGLGCVAGAAGIARLHDYLRGRPEDVAVLLSVELCSLTFQATDASPANMIASGLFGDGAAAVVACGGQRVPAAEGPAVVATRSRMYPDTEHAMGWEIGDFGLRVVLDPSVPDVVRHHLADDVRAFLRDHGLKPDDVTAWVCHPGGPKILNTVTEVLGLAPDALDLTWRHLAEAGNLSSSSVLHVLRDTLAERRPPPGSPGLLLAMGPGFCCELVLLRW
ncbi:type III polyketide synthase [Streptomyces mobaraensis]|uniref:Type III polyketide synthase n=1 Tax=Streptomyces mobaraensis TaxID=35621 RepID=A0A5N5W470_STRMB|nr:3-oxoacyl-[acyl-carrier-protein] synthase III C-terminal domain-containing protein [Streptomyces mobaraensis]KAB7839618.1 type III polyketide synthase [Streptomyces mobaraensis]